MIERISLNDVFLEALSRKAETSPTVPRATSNTQTTRRTFQCGAVDLMLDPWHFRPSNVSTSKGLSSQGFSFWRGFV